jgi:hypothetical protein
MKRASKRATKRKRNPLVFNESDRYTTAAPKRKRLTTTRRLRSKGGRIKKVTTHITLDANVINATINRKIAELEAQQEFYWVTQDGRSVRPSGMDEQHLRNTISFLARRLITQLSQTTWLESTAYFVEALAHMLHEAKRRGLRV